MKSMERSWEKDVAPAYPGPAPTTPGPLIPALKVLRRGRDAHSSSAPCCTSVCPPRCPSIAPATCTWRLLIKADQTPLGSECLRVSLEPSL